MHADERALGVFGIAVRLTGAGMNALIFHNCILVSSRQVGEPRHALPVVLIGLKHGVVAMCLENVRWLQLQ